MVKAFTRVHRGAVDRTPKYPFSGMCLQLSPVVTQPLRSQTYMSFMLLLVFLIAASACPGNAVSNRLCIDTAYAQIEADGVRLQTRLASSCTLLDKVVEAQNRSTNSTTRRFSCGPDKYHNVTLDVEVTDVWRPMPDEQGVKSLEWSTTITRCACSPFHRFCLLVASSACSHSRFRFQIPTVTHRGIGRPKLTTRGPSPRATTASRYGQPKPTGQDSKQRTPAWPRHRWLTSLAGPTTAGTSGPPTAVAQ